MGKIVIRRDYCKGCELCTTACGKKLLKVGSTFNKSGYYTVEYCGEEGACTGCALCAEMCPDAAIEVWKEDGKPITNGKDQVTQNVSTYNCT